MSADWSIGCIPYKRALLTPEKTAIIFEDIPITYRKLNEGINKTAHMLEKKGIKKGDRVGLILLNCIEFLEVYFACAKLGAILVPLNWRLVWPELEYQLNDSSVRLLVFHDTFLGSIDLIRNKLKVEQGKFIFLPSGNNLLPGFQPPKCPEWADDYHKIVDGQPVSEPYVEDPVDLNDSLAIIYTSGVTGKPKGAVVSHLQTYFKNFQVRIYTDSQPGDVIIAQMPLFHSGGLFIVVTPSLCSGVTIVMRRGFDPNEFAEDIQRYKGTIILHLPPCGALSWKPANSTRSMSARCGP